MKESIETIKSNLNTKTFMTKEEILDCFKGIGQTELPTRGEIKETVHKKRKLTITNEEGQKVAIQTTKGIVKPINLKPSRSYLSNLNPRITKADRIWKSIWGHEKGDLLRAIGVSKEEIVELAQSSKCPDKVIDYFIMNKNQPEEFHHNLIEDLHGK